jgi:hypothetical protein
MGTVKTMASGHMSSIAWSAFIVRLVTRSGDVKPISAIAPLTDKVSVRTTAQIISFEYTEKSPSLRNTNGVANGPAGSRVASDEIDNLGKNTIAPISVTTSASAAIQLPTKPHPLISAFFTIRHRRCRDAGCVGRVF